MVSGLDKSANLQHIHRLTGAAASAGADLAVFPEFAMYDVPRLTSEFVSQAEGLDGTFVASLTELSARTGVVLVAGMLETVEDSDRAHNTLVLITPGEGLTRVYRKTHLYDAFGFKESEYIAPGPLEGPVTFTVADCTVGMLTCYDLRFPEPARQHADAGVDVLLYPSAWIPGPRKEDHWNTLVRARAIENTFYVAAVSQGPGSGVGIGCSLVSDPMGMTVAELGETTDIALAEIDPQRVADVRKVNPCLENRRFSASVDARATQHS